MATASKKEIAEVIKNLNDGVDYSNEAAGYSYSKGQALIKFQSGGKMIFYPTIEKMARAIVKSCKTGS